MANDFSSYFRKGSDVEISRCNDEGFRGAWYEGTVVGPTKSKNKLLVQYKTLVAKDGGSRPLREVLDVVQLRPLPPREIDRRFNFNEEVDAHHDDGWWEGVIAEVLDSERYSVFFRGSKEQKEFDASELRLRREWLNGKWISPFEDEQKISMSTEVKQSKGMVEEKFNEGTLVEVSSDEDGFQGAWFAATVVKKFSNNKFLIEYQNLRNDDDTEFMREEVDNLHVRPYPPDSMVKNFQLLEEVDALYNDGWWVGVISKVLDGERYFVYFRGTNEEMEFKHSDLRLHQEWIAGKWIIASKMATIDAEENVVLISEGTSKSKVDLWSDNNTNIFVELMENEVLVGNRTTTTFTKNSWNTILDEMNRRTGLTFEVTQLKNKFNKMRTVYRCFNSLLKETGAGFTYDKPTGRICASDNQWKRMAGVNKYVKHFQKNGCPLYPKLCVIYGDTTAMGRYVYASTQPPSSLNEIDPAYEPKANEVGDDNIVEVGAKFSKKKEKGKRKHVRKDSVGEAFESMATSFVEGQKKRCDILEEHLTRYSSKSNASVGNVTKITDPASEDQDKLVSCMEILNAMGIEDMDKYLHAVEHLVNNVSFRTVFFHMLPEAQRAWVMRGQN